MKELKSHIDYTPILRRIQNGDLSVASIELGKSITYQEHEGFIPLGVQECDTIAIEEKSGEIVLLDHEVSGRIMGLIANNLISFIYALCEIEEHFEKCEENEDLYDDEAFMIASARRAGHLAGGDRYASFYSNLFWNLTEYGNTDSQSVSVQFHLENKTVQETGTVPRDD